MARDLSIIKHMKHLDLFNGNVPNLQIFLFVNSRKVYKQLNSNSIHWKLKNRKRYYDWQVDIQKDKGIFNCRMHTPVINGEVVSLLQSHGQ